MEFRAGDRVETTLSDDGVLRGTVEKVQPSHDGKKFVVIVVWDYGARETLPPRLHRLLRHLDAISLLAELA